MMYLSHILHHGLGELYIDFIIEFSYNRWLVITHTTEIIWLLAWSLTTSSHDEMLCMWTLLRPLLWSNLQHYLSLPRSLNHVYGISLLWWRLRDYIFTLWLTMYCQSVVKVFLQIKLVAKTTFITNKTK